MIQIEQFDSEVIDTIEDKQEEEEIKVAQQQYNSITIDAPEPLSLDQFKSHASILNQKKSSVNNL